MKRIFSSLAAGLVALLLVAGAAHADPKSFNWNDPTSYTDSSSLDPATIEQWELGCGPTSGNRTGLVFVWTQPDVRPRVENFPPGDWYCAVRITMSASATYPGTVSDWSNEAMFSVAVRPNPPSGLFAQ